MRDETCYRVIAPYYDWIMAHVDYDAWGSYLGRLWRKFGPEPRAILELGAGTCPFGRRRVYPPAARVVYADLSPFMLRHSPGPAAGNGDGAASLRVCANALALPLRGEFQLCLMVYDALNYLMTEADVARCFREVRGVLARGGLFLFDITTEANSRRHFHQSMDFGEMEGCSYVRESRYDGESRVQRNDFTFFLENGRGCWRRLRETHQQRIYRVAGIKRLAAAAGFALLGCFEGFTFRPGQERSERVHFALRKA